MRAIRRGDAVYLAAIGGERSAWVKNIRANPEVRLRIRDGSFGGRARELRDETERADARDAYCGTVNGFDYREYRVHRTGRPSRAGIEELHRACSTAASRWSSSFRNDGSSQASTQA